MLAQSTASPERRVTHSLGRSADSTPLSAPRTGGRRPRCRRGSRVATGARRHTHPHAACLHATAVATAAIAILSQLQPEFLVPLMTRDLTFLAQAPSCGPRHPTGARQLEFHWKRGRWPTFLLFMASTALTFLPNGRVSPSYAGFLAHTTLFMRCSRCSALAASSTLMVSMAWFTLDLVMVLGG